MAVPNSTAVGAYVAAGLGLSSTTTCTGNLLTCNLPTSTESASASTSQTSTAVPYYSNNTVTDSEASSCQRSWESYSSISSRCAQTIILYNSSQPYQATSVTRTFEITEGLADVCTTISGIPYAHGTLTATATSAVTDSITSSSLNGFAASCNPTAVVEPTCSVTTTTVGSDPSSTTTQSPGFNTLDKRIVLGGSRELLCSIIGKNVQLFYWPDISNGYSNTTGNRSTPVTTVVSIPGYEDPLTFTSPSVYLRLDTVSAISSSFSVNFLGSGAGVVANTTTTLGSVYTNLVLTLPPSAVKSVIYTLAPGGGNTDNPVTDLNEIALQIATGGPSYMDIMSALAGSGAYTGYGGRQVTEARPIEWGAMAVPSPSAYYLNPNGAFGCILHSDHPACSTVFEGAYFPRVDVGEGIKSVDPAWSLCQDVIYGLYDPASPSALAKQETAAGPSTPTPFAAPSTTPASPATSPGIVTPTPTAQGDPISTPDAPNTAQTDDGPLDVPSQGTATSADQSGAGNRATQIQTSDGSTQATQDTNTPQSESTQQVESTGSTNAPTPNAYSRPSSDEASAQSTSDNPSSAEGPGGNGGTDQPSTPGSVTKIITTTSYTQVASTAPTGGGSTQASVDDDNETTTRGTSPNAATQQPDNTSQGGASPKPTDALDVLKDATSAAASASSAATAQSDAGGAQGPDDDESTYSRGQSDDSGISTSAGGSEEATSQPGIEYGQTNPVAAASTNGGSGPTNAGSPSDAGPRTVIYTTDGVKYTASQVPGQSSQYALPDTTVSVGGSAAIVSGHTVSADPSGLAVDGTLVVAKDGNDQTGISGSQTNSPVIVVTTDGLNFTASKVSGQPAAYTFPGTMVSVGGPAATIDGHTVSAGASGLVVDGMAVGSLSTPEPGSIGPLVTTVTYAGQSFTFSQDAANGNPVVDGSITITVGGSATSINGQYVSAGQNSIVVGTSTVSLAAAGVDVISAGSTSFTTSQDAAPGVEVVDGTISLTAGRAAATADGHTFSAYSGGVVVDGNSHPVQRPTVSDGQSPTTAQSGPPGSDASVTPALSSSTSSDAGVLRVSLSLLISSAAMLLVLRSR
ncbi:hypothetical protein LTR22_024741 [Elasticomyces elasticus]|nr:hypothetical protein LTR22_024741 [Elasticomyces elasticus]KAK4905420.1 hypothetical protein LTR49_025285 [Elasticomyces elasticus]KAK5737519.1 hypothetical protein LTS12_025867 [Elasticomyces elasticus]